jgi:hypothetical protein
MRSTLRKDQCTFITIPRSFLLRMRNISDKIVEKIKDTHFIFDKVFRI